MKDDHRSFVSVVQNDSIFKVEKEALFNKQEKWWRWPEKLNLWKCGIGWHIQKNTIKNINLLKMSLLVQIGEELWVTLCFRGLHPDLFEKVLNLELAPILKAPLNPTPCPSHSNANKLYLLFGRLTHLPMLRCPTSRKQHQRIHSLTCRVTMRLKLKLNKFK